MITAFLLLAAEPAIVSADSARFEACAALADTAPERAIEEANAWRLAGGGVLARQCAGLAYVKQARWVAAAAAFESAAKDAEVKGDARASVLWVQAGNAALAGNEPSKATQFLDAAIARGQLEKDALGEAYLDRGRARAALGQLPAARIDLDQATKLVPADPLGWLLSATLARKMGNLRRAQTDIVEAVARSPDDASVALEAGNIAILSGHADAARTAWEASVRNAPDSPQVARQPKPWDDSAKASRVTAMKYLHTMIRVSDPDATIRFFELLGLKEHRRFDNPAGRFTLIFLAALDDEDAQVELTHNWDEQAMARGAISAISPTVSTTSTRRASG